MKRALSVLFSMAMMVAFLVPAAAQGDSTPDASTPVASPSAAALQPGVTDYAKTDEDDSDVEDMLTIDLTALQSDDDGIAIMDSYDPEADAADGYSFVEEHDAADDCRIIEYTSEDDEGVFIGICADDDFGLWIIGSEQEAVEHVTEQFSNGETNLVPEGYEEVEDQ